MYGVVRGHAYDILIDIIFDIGINIMTALSLHLPDKLAKESQDAAHRLGISRAEFIRQAIEHELESQKAQLELDAITESFAAMKKHPDYLKESQEIDEDLNVKLPKDKNQWWKKTEEK